MLTGAQVRMARAFLRLSAQQLATEAGLGISTVQRIEAQDGVPSTSTRSLSALEAFFDAKGVKFSRTEDGGLRIETPPAPEAGV